jgi:hypothetical protein
MRMLLTIIMIVAFAGTALAQVPVIADFEAGINNGGWNASGFGSVESLGGNPDGWLNSGLFWAPYPVLTSEYDAPGWSGDMTNATNISADLQTVSSDNQYLGEYYFVVLFRNGMGTPNDQYDDVYVYTDAYVDGRTAPDPGAGWEHYDIELPFDFTGAPQEVPAGWTGGSPYNITQLPADVTFQDVVQNVTQIEFWWNHPDWAAIFGGHTIGADNIVLEFGDGPVATEEQTFGALKALYR